MPADKVGNQRQAARFGGYQPQVGGEITRGPAWHRLCKSPCERGARRLSIREVIKWALALAAAAITVLTFNAASAQGTLRIGMTASDIPLTTGQTDQGGEGMRFMGYTVYDALINWDLSSVDKPSDLVPGLATSYGVDPADADKTAGSSSCARA